MKIGIIGGGAIGLLFAHYLSKNHDVTIYTRTEEQAELLKQDGLHFVVNGQVQTEKVEAHRLSEGAKDEDLVIVTVKQYHLLSINDWMKHITSPLLFLQNGYGHIEFIKELSSPDIFVGVVEHGALRHNWNTVEHTGLGKTKLAIFRGNRSKLRIVDESIPSFPFQWHGDFHSMLLEKLIVNAVINPLTAVLDVPNGQLVMNASYQQLMDLYMDELAAILRIENVTDTLEHVKYVCRTTAGNRSSMLKDLENGRQTEIDAILGYVLYEAQQNKQDCPLTQFLYTIIKGKERQKG
jgi:2-dehydropantoate 2-reductase